MKTRWFIECDPVLNEQVAEFITQHGFTDADMSRTRNFADGKSRDLWQIPSNLVQKIIAFGRKNPQLKFHFFTQSSPYAKLIIADFVKTKRKSKKVQKVLSDIKKIQIKNKNT